MRELLTPIEYERRESKLSPELQAFVRTSEFKEWFGDWENDPDNASKMIDENGEPEVVYTGLPAGIHELHGGDRLHTGDDEVGFYFTRKRNFARNMAAQRRDFRTDEPIPSSLYSAFLNIRYPYEVRRGDGVHTTGVTIDKIPEGVDGFINDKLREIVVFDPSQVALVKEESVNP
ncbi:MAG TPA: hypothetical protein VLG09_00990 [Candidatus Saccharimonadales bacterium]|nr:hypothetical protein [Candidatus Saccharimonadales bacterium]